MHNIYREKKEMSANEVIMYNTLADWVSEDSEVVIINNFVERFVKEEQPYYSKGQSNIGLLPYGMRPLLKLFIYGYLNRIQSSRRLAAECCRNIEVIYLMGNLRPAYHTIADFRKDNADLISNLVFSLRRYLQQEGFIKGESVSIDGTKVKALANRTITQVLERDIEKVKKSISDYLLAINSNDTECDKKDETISYLESKVAHLENQLQHVKANDPIEGYNLYDKDCELMRFKDKQTLPAYNTQVAVDNESHMIVAADVTTQANDINQLKPMVEECQSSTGAAPKQVIADSGYYKFDAIDELQKNGTACIISCRESPHREADVKAGLEFKYNPQEDLYICPQNKELPFRSIKQKRGRNYRTYQAKASDCRECKLYGICTEAKHGRSYWRSITTKEESGFRREMQTPEAIALIKARKGYIENVFGTIKTWMGKLPLLLRGKEKAQTEINLYVVCYNLKRFMNTIRERASRPLLSLENVPS